MKGLDTDYLNFLRFFLLGIDLSKLDQSYFGDKDSSRAQRNMRIYNKFFEIALFTALRWFFNSSEEVSVTKIFAEKRCLPNDDPFTTHAPQMIRRRESNIVVQTNHVSMIDAKAEKETAHPGLRDCLQIVDVYTGALSQLLDNSNCKSGCCEVATALAPRAKKLMEQPFNSKSCCWKRVALRFFPKSSVTGDGLLNGVRKGEMYEQRQLTYLERDQLRLFD